jgi:hypothetical protein
MRTNHDLPTALALALVALAASCKAGPPPAPPATLSSAPAAESPSLKERMRGHAAHGAAARDAVARADLDAARVAAKALAELRVEVGLAPALRKDLDAMNEAARHLEAAETPREASRRLAALAQACGDCHATLGGGVGAASASEPPDDDLGVRPRMKRHDWAVSRLWDGLVSPSDRSWKAGAHVLADAPLEPEPLTPGKSPVPEIGELATGVHELASHASVAKSSVDRTAILGQLMATCAACHQRLGGGPDGTAPRN